MPAQSISTTANRPDYSELKQATFGVNPVDSIDQALDAALPDNPQNSTLPKLKNLVRQFMSQRDANGLTLVPNTRQAMLGVSDSIVANPQLANTELVRSITHTALHDGELTVAGGETYLPQGTDCFPHGRQGAVRTLGTVVDKRPELADATLVKNVTQIAATDPDSGVRSEAQNTLGKIVAKRPDLIDVDVVNVVSHTAESPILDHGQHVGSALPWVQAGKLLGNLDDAADNKARNTAQQTLKTIEEKRPDLTGGSTPATAAPKQNGGSPHLHANLPPPRPSMAP